MDDETYRQLMIVLEDLMKKNGTDGDGPFASAIGYLAPLLEAYEAERKTV
jgi:hypothetical protein